MIQECQWTEEGTPHDMHPDEEQIPCSLQDCPSFWLVTDERRNTRLDNISQLTKELDTAQTAVQDERDNSATARNETRVTQ